jgi:proteasome lid subunit RPN8/RPN11
MLILAPLAAQAIAAHAESTYPDECVGLLLGTLDGSTRHVQAIFPVENSWQGQMSLADDDDAQSRRDRFYLDPRDYLRADREARARGLDVVGCYHSHPDHPAEPSERDRVGAQGVGGGHGFAFVIQSVVQGSATELASWLLMDEGTRFEQERIDVRE